MIHIKNKIHRNKNRKLFYNQNFKVAETTNKKILLNLENKILKFNIPALIGFHQIENAATAITAAYQIKKLGYQINQNSINEALKKINLAWKIRKKIFKKNTCLY